jgi:hypothetical protein
VICLWAVFVASLAPHADVRCVAAATVNMGRVLDKIRLRSLDNDYDTEQ